MRREPAIDAYLANVSPRNRALLRALRKTIHTLVPEVEECISYRLAGYDQTKGALHFGAEKPLPALLVRKLLKARIAEGR